MYFFNKDKDKYSGKLMILYIKNFLGCYYCIVYSVWKFFCMYLLSLS